MKMISKYDILVLQNIIKEIERADAEKGGYVLVPKKCLHQLVELLDSLKSEQKDKSA